MGRDHLIDPHDQNCMHFELQNWLSWVGDIELQYQKTSNNQLDGSNSLEVCMAWDGCTRLGPETVSGEAIAVAEGAVIEGVMQTTGRTKPVEFVEKRDAD